MFQFSVKQTQADDQPQGYLNNDPRKNSPIFKGQKNNQQQRPQGGASKTSAPKASAPKASTPQNVSGKSGTGNASGPKGSSQCNSLESCIENCPSQGYANCVSNCGKTCWSQKEVRIFTWQNNHIICKIKLFYHIFVTK